MLSAIEARALVFEAFFTAAIERGSFADFLARPIASAVEAHRDALVRQARPADGLLTTAVEVALLRAQEDLLRGLIPGLNASLEVPLAIVFDAQWPTPELPPPLVRVARDRLGAPLAWGAGLTHGPDDRGVQDAIISGESWFMWPVERSDQRAEAPAESDRVRVPERDTEGFVRVTVVLAAATASTASVLEGVAERWLTEL